MADFIATIEETAQIMRDNHRMAHMRCCEGAFHEVNFLCPTTHTPWKNCGVECCIDPD